MSCSPISRRDFFRLSASSLGALSALATPGANAADRAGGVSIVVDPADRQASAPSVEWAIQELESALSQRGLTLRRFEAIDQAPRGNPCIVASTPTVPAAMQVLSHSAVPAPAAPESLVIVPASFAGRSGLLTCGADSRGLTYALLELTDRMLLQDAPTRALSFGAPHIERPHNALRGIARMFVSDIEDKPWFNDREFWPPYLSMIAAQRFNRFQLTLGLGYDSLRGVTDAYLLFAYPFLLAVPGYRVRAVGLPDAERDQNLAMLQFIGRETVKRGMDFQLGLWTHGYEWLDSPHVNYTIEGLTPDNHGAYCRDALAALLHACPTVSGVTLRTHAESGVREGSYAFWRTVFDGVARSGRKVEIDLHTKGLDGQLVDAALATGMPVRLSPKYWAEHIGMPYQQAAIRELEMAREHTQTEGFAALSEGSRSFTRYGYADFLRDDRRYRVHYRVFPGTHRLLLTGDPATAASHARAFGFCGGDGGEFFEPLSYKGRRGSGVAGGRCAYADRSLEPRRDWEKYLYTYRIWGRLLYDPAAKPEVWRRFLRHRYQASALHVEAALASATRILPIVTTAHLPSAANDTFMPEIYTSQPIADPALPHPYGDTPTPKVFGHVSPLDPQFFSSVEEFANEILEGKRTGKYSPSEVARWLDDLASSAERAIDEALQNGSAEPNAKLPPSNAELRRVELDVRIQIGLGRFFATKLRSAALYALYGRTSSVAALEEALREYQKARTIWSQFAEHARGLYVADITIGPLPHQRGHWLDRLPAMDADIAALRRQLESAPAQPPHAAGNPQQMHELLSDARDTSLTPRHHSPERFVPNEPLSLTAVLDHSAQLLSARLLYRHVNQAEEYQAVDLVESGGEHRAVIPAAYTASPYPLQYFFELIYEQGRARRYPGFSSELDNQPYFVVRAAPRRMA